MMDSFQEEMKQRYRISPILVDKYKDELFFMVEIDFTCMEVVVPQVKFIEPMAYEMSEELIEGCAQIIHHSKFDSKCPRLGTYIEKMREFKTSQIIKDSNKKEEKVIDSILKESRMTRKEFDEVKGIAMEMKASGQSELLTPTPIVVVGPTKEVLVT